LFFPELIQSIRPGDRVLEIGPGSSPHPRSEVFLEKRFDEPEATRQRGGMPAAPIDRKVVYYDGGAFPFDDHEFDYVICSHVLEHVANVDSFVSELVRVASAGYLEFPKIHYEYLYNFPEHLTVLLFRDPDLYWLPKSAFLPENLSDLHEFFRRSLDAGYIDILNRNRKVFFQGFEWTGSVPLVKARSISDLIDIPEHLNPPTRNDSSLNASNAIKYLVNRIPKRIVEYLQRR
jgi:hypothetical protein